LLEVEFDELLGCAVELEILLLLFVVLV